MFLFVFVTAKWASTSA